MNAMVRVMAMARGALREGYTKVISSFETRMKEKAYIRHFFGDMCDTIEATQTIKGIDQAGNEANNIAVPAGVVDPCSENEVGRLMRWSTCHDRDQYD